uniref:Peptidase S1 domain-containing protein n=1 Tax=Mus spicilegus TaxID=10103 RepID=A0A8C6I2Q0_MUSSI
WWCHGSFLTLALTWQIGALSFAQPRITGGWECERPPQPWQVAVYHYNKAVCGGVLVQPQWVLTASHCIGSKSKVRLDQHSLSADEGQYVSV